MKITIQGHSDDILMVESETFGIEFEAGKGVLALSNGSLFSVDYDDRALWCLQLIGSQIITTYDITLAAGTSDDYSDVIKVYLEEDLWWVLYAEESGGVQVYHKAVNGTMVQRPGP